METKAILRFICSLLSAGILLFCVTMAAHADPETKQTTETISVEVGKDGGTEPAVEETPIDSDEDVTIGQESPAPTSTQTTTSTETATVGGSDLENEDGAEDGEESASTYVEHIDTALSDETPCEVVCQVTVPIGFTSDAYIIFESDTTGTQYRVTMIADNNYTQRIYVDYGHYTIKAVGVYDSDAFSFVIDQSGFTLDENDNTASLSYTMKNLDSIVQDETGNFIDQASGTTTVNNEVRYTTPYDFILMSSDGTLFYDVTHSNEQNPGNLTVTGFADGNYDVVFRIKNGGVIGEATYVLSLDGGDTWVAEGTVEETISTEYGLTFTVTTNMDTDELVAGDDFSCQTIECFKVDTATSVSDAQLMIVGHPKKSHELYITVLSTGGFNVSKVSVEDDKGNLTSYTGVIPEDGKIELDDGLTLVFKDLTGYQKGVKFSSSIISNDTSIDYTPLIFLCIGAGVLALFVIAFLLGKKDRQSDYVIQQYHWQKDDAAYQPQNQKK